MINPFNAGDHSIKVSNLRGDHKANIVYCGKLVKHPYDVHYGWLECSKIIEGEFPLPNTKDLSFDDRIYFGELHIRGLVGIDEIEIEDDSEQ